MSDDQFIIDLIVKMRDDGVQAGIRGIVNEINRVSEGTKNTGIDRMSRDLLKLGQDADKAETATRGWSQSLASVHGTQFAAEIKAADSAAQSFNKTMLEQSRLKNLPTNTTDTTKVGSSFGNIVNQDDKLIQQASRSYKNLSTDIDGAIEARKRESASFADSIRARMNASVADDKVAASTEKARLASEKAAQSLSTTRYALYDVAGTATIAGVAMAGLATAVFAAGIAWDRGFANVVRTASLDGDVEKIKALRQEFVELNQTLPVAASELAEIGALGGQLGIESSGLQSFTTVVAQLTATTDLSAEAAGTALGRFQALMAVPSSEFSNLASSILKVGVNSVATETQIVNTATQISSMGRFAGLSADQVVGLAGALASVGAQPELARGTVTRTFTLMSRAIAEGGEKLEAFAKTSGVSSAEFSSSFGTAKFAPIFQSFLKGLDGIQVSGGNAVQTLNDMGISSVRDVPLLLRLAAAGDVVSGAFADAATGYEDNTELANQYSIVAGTMAAKLQLLANNFQQFIVALADGGEMFGGVVDGLTEMLQWLTEMANTPFVGEVLQWGVVLTGALGVILLVAGGLARTTGAVIGIAQAYIGLTASSAASNTQLGVSAGLMNALGLSSGKAATAVAALGLAIKAITFAGIAASVIAAVPMIKDALNEAMGVTNEFGDVAQRLADSKGFDTYSKAMVTAVTDTKKARDILSGMDMASLGAFGENINKLQKEMSSAAKSGDTATLASQFALLRKETDWDAATILQAMPDLAAAMERAGITATMAANGTISLKNAVGEAVDPTQALADAEAAAEAATAELAASLGLMPEELAGLTDALSAGSGMFFDFAKAAKEAYSDTGDGISQFIEALNEQLVAQEAWATNVTILTARGASAFVTELAKMGPDGAKLAADAVNLTGEELAALEEKTRRSVNLSSEAWATTLAENTPMMAAAYGVAGDEGVKKLQEALGKGDAAVMEALKTMAATARANPVPVDATTSAAVTAVENFVRQMSLKSITIRVATSTDGSISRVLPGLGSYSNNYATGGPVYGPGTGTSDSIPARLSNGEYVITAARVRQFGVGYFDSLNSGRAPRQFAAGGPVNPQPVASASSGMTSLDPAAMRLLRDISDRIGNVEVSFVDISKAAANGDRSLAGRGGR